MDKDTFLMVEREPVVDDFFSRHRIIVDGRPGSSHTTSSPVLRSPALRSIAIVDRTSVISKAARDLIRARFAFGGQSPYAPDLVLVNEFVLDEFCIAAAKHAAEHFGVSLPVAGNVKGKMKAFTDLQTSLHESDTGRFVSGSSQRIAIIEDR